MSKHTKRQVKFNNFVFDMRFIVMFVTAVRVFVCLWPNIFWIKIGCSKSRDQAAKLFKPKNKKLLSNTSPYASL